MALQTSGAISLLDIATEFGGTAPHAMSEYYGGGDNVGAGPGVPASGELTLSDFYGTQAQAAFSTGDSYSSFEEVGKAMAVTATTSLTQNISTNINSTSIGNWDYVIRDAETISSFSSATYFSGTTDTRGTFVTWKGDLTINSGQTFQPSGRKLWTVLYVDGDLTLNGGISMSQRGANHSGTSAAAMRIVDGTYSSVSNAQVPAAGGAQQTSNGSTGNSGTSGGTGGGGAGYSGDPGRALGGYGAAGTSFTGGSGGGGVDGCTSHATANGGRGGNGCGERAGAGAGNPGGSGHAASNGGAGTGGVLIVICTGTITGGGTMTATGANGSCWSGSRSGGGSGGGSVTALVNTNSWSGTITANGGTSCQGNGGSGTARILTGL